MSAKTIAYLCSSKSWGGLEMNHLKCAVWMQDLGYTTFIFALKNTPLYNNAILEGVNVIEISEHKKYFDFKAGKKLAQQLDQLKISHLIIRDKKDISVSGIAKNKSKNRIHLSYFMAMQLGVTKKGVFQTLRYRKLDLWSCPSEFLANQVRTMTNMPKDKIKIIPDGIDMSYLQTEISKTEARKLLELPQDKIVLGLIGRFDPQKGQTLALEALSKIENKDIVLCFLGEPTKEDGDIFVELLKDRIEELQLTDRVFIRPFRKDVSSFYYAIDVLLMATKSETFGMVTVEAMACGKPVIASNAGGSPELLEFGKAGYLFETLNPTSLAKEINSFNQNPTKFQPKSLRKAVAKFGKENSCRMVSKELDLM